jgi:putative sterol carrier protein
MSTQIERPSDWFTQILPARVQSGLAAAAGFEGTFCMQLPGEGGGEWTCRIGPDTVCVEPGLTEAAFTMSIAPEVFVQLVNGQLNARSLYATGRLRVTGDMGQAMRLFRLFVG